MKKKLLFGFLVWSCLAATAQTRQQTFRSDINLSDPFILADTESKRYYMTGTNGELYQSDDLELWTGPDKVIEVADKAWFGAAPAVWASEIHHIDNSYYYFSTFTNNSIQVDEQGHPRRAVHILRSSLPNGTYSLVPASANTYLPAEKTTLDGTYFQDTDGKRYLLYCHEWIQNGNGTIEYIELKPDLTGTVGEGVVMTRAHDATWNTSPVTDGPYLFRTQTGRLGMIWTSWRGDRYVQGVAYSSSGRISGPWVHEPLPITPDNYGHGMLFRTFEGQLLMCIHSHRNINLDAQHFERHPVLFVMDDSGNRLRTVMEYKRNVGPANPARVMVDNPEFEYGKQGWKCNTGAQNQLIATNQSGAITGNFFESWDANSYTGEIFQEKSVPNGTYQLTAAAFRSQLISGGKQDEEAVYLFANDELVLVDNTTPQYYTVTAHVTDGKLRFGLRSTKRNFRWMGIDNVTINYFGEVELTDDEINQAERNAAVYLRNSRNGRYLGAGQSWGTQAILASHPLDLRLNVLPDKRYAIDSRIDNGGGNHYVGSNGYMDSPLSPFYVNFIDEHIVTISPDGKHYWGSTGTSTVNTTMTNPDNQSAQWECLTYDDLLAGLSDATANSPADATFLIQCPDFGRNDTRISAWKGSGLTAGGDVKNQCAQAPTGVFDIYQRLEGIPNGFYQLSVQGFSRHATAKLYAGKDEVSLRDIASERGTQPTDLETASGRFSAAKYSNTLNVEVTDGTLRLGIKQDKAATASNAWIVFDNFELTYLGTEANAVNQPVATRKRNGGVYDLGGRKIQHPSRNGVYIVDGKKVFSAGNPSSR